MKLYGMELIRALSDISSPSGDEVRAAAFIIEQLGDDAETYVDRVGNVVAKIAATGDGSRTMFCAHMDEPGFLVWDIDESGKVWIRFFGGVPTERISGRWGLINGNVPCVFSAKPIHALSSDERTKPTAADKIYAETGAKDKESAEATLKIGDRGTFAPSFEQVGRYIKGKALGARAACAALIETARKISKEKLVHGELYFVFTTYGEVGNMGAEVAANVISPAKAVIVDGIAAYDTPDVPNEMKISSLGAGAVISVADAKTIFSRSLVEKCMEIADNGGIKYQYVMRQSQVGEGAAVQRALGGCECVSVSIPTRYKKSASEMISTNDFEAVSAILAALIEI